MSENDRVKWNKRYRERARADALQPSAFLEQWIGRIPRGRALDVACGAGRNALFLAASGFEVDAIDISKEGLDRARENARGTRLHVNWLEHDLDEPLAMDTAYQLIAIIRYVNLPLTRQLTGHLAPGGFLVCEEHLVSEADVIGPANPAYRVTSADLLEAVEGLRIVHVEEVTVPDRDGRNAALARVVAQRL